MGALTALLDANVLYSAGLRDFLLRLADQYLYAPLWSADIHAEWIRSVLANRPDLTADVLERTRAVMDQHFPDAVVTGHSARTAGLDPSDAGDLHVLAAAIEGGADLIVTHNLRDFPTDCLASYGLTAQHPDAFIVDLLEADLGSCARGCSRPPRGVEKSAANCGRTLGRTRTSGSDPNGVADSTAPWFRLIGTAEIIMKDSQQRDIECARRVATEWK